MIKIVDGQQQIRDSAANGGTQISSHQYV